MNTLVEAAYRRPLRAALVALALLVVTVAVLTLPGGGDDTPSTAPAPGVSTAPPVDPSATASDTPAPPRRTGFQRAADLPGPVAVSFVRSWLNQRLSKSAWEDAVTNSATHEFAEGLRATDRSLIPDTTVRFGTAPEVTGSVAEGGAKVTVPLANGDAVVVTLAYQPEAQEWLIANLEPVAR